MTRTNAFTLLCVALRVFALWFLASVLLAAPGIIVGLRQALPDARGYWIVYAAIVLIALIAALVWLFAEKLARLALSRPQDHVFESDLDASTWFGVGLSIMGAWFALNALADGAHLAARAFAIAQYRKQSYGADAVPYDDMAVQIIDAVVRGVLGAVFVLRGRGLAALLHRWRNAGRWRTEPALREDGSDAP